MEDGLLIFLSGIGLLALYWVLFGQWKHNKMMRGENNEEQPSDKTKRPNS